MQTGIPYVFAGGDMVTGPDTIIQAVAAGHKAVEAIHRYINGEDLELYAQQLEAQEKPGNSWQKVREEIPQKARARPQHLDAKMSTACFDEVDLGFSESQAQQEARRCLNCGVCCECMECVKVCEPKAIDHNMQPEELATENSPMSLPHLSSSASAMLPDPPAARSLSEMKTGI